MPVRTKAVSSLVSSLTEHDDWLAPDDVFEEYDTAYVRMIDHIDWQRVFLEASARHIALDHPYDCEGTHDYGLVCPECMNEALLATDRGGWTDWNTQPRVTRP